MFDFEFPPRKPGEPMHTFSGVQSVVVVGANGSGKTRLGAWIEQRAGARSHRVSAQRALTMPPLIQPRQYDHARAALFYGRYNPGSRLNPNQVTEHRLQARWSNEPATSLLNDFQHVLALLFADEAKRSREYTRGAMTSMPSSKPPPCRLDQLARIWASVFPHRELIVGDDTLRARLPGGSEYDGRHMSDGERVAIYLMGQALCAPEAAIIVVDEPEIHLHRGIQGRLWDQIETVRSDCVFVYITHDLEFAASRTTATKIWVKRYDGAQWDWDVLDAASEVPDPLLFEIAGSRRPVLFVEGTRGSHDAALYSLLFPDDLVVPRESCAKVAEATKAMASLDRFHHLRVRGIVDRDRRPDEEVDALKSHGVLVADVAEVENLLCLPESIKAAAEKLAHADSEAACAVAMDAVLDDFARVATHQSMGRTLARIQFRLGGFGPKIGTIATDSLAVELQSYVTAIDVAAIDAESAATIRQTIQARDYRAALRYYNSKGVMSVVAKALGVSRDVYANLVLAEVRMHSNGEVARAMRHALGAENARPGHADRECDT